MGHVVKDAKELAQAIKSNEDYIEIEGDLKKGVVKVKGTGKIAWALCFSCIAIAAAATAYIVMKNDEDAKTKAVAAISATAAVAILGPTTAATCVMMAVYAGNVDVISKLREYRIEEQGDRLFLVK